MKKRIVALFLCLSMLMTMFVGAVAAEDGSYGANVGRYAVIAEDGYGLQVGNFTDISTGNDMYFAYEEFEPGTIFKITDWYLDSETQSLWYAVEFYAGGVIPEAQEDWPAMPWVLQDYVGEEAMGDSLAFLDGCDICGKPDCGGHESVGDTTKVFVDGVEAQQLTMPQFDKPTLSAATTLTGAVAYQWQILADRETELWVNIYGEDQPDLTLTYGMVASLLDSNYQAQVRCVTTAGDTKSVSEALTITLEPRVIPVAPDAEDPTEPTEEPAEPTEETAEPTEEPTEPTEVTTEPTEVTTEPTEDTTEPTEETTEPTEETTEPTEETTEPTEETTEPTEPTEVTTEPTEETTEPTEETTEPTEGVAELSNEVEQLPEVQVTYTAATTLADGEPGEGDTRTYLVTIHYLFRNGETAASTDSITVGATGVVQNPIRYPAVEGYLPYIINAEGEPERQDEFAARTLTEDVELTVYYLPAEVPYEIVVYLQNVENDGYTRLPDTITRYALTGSLVPDFTQEQPDGVKLEYEGFYPLLHEMPEVAADGSTEVEMYFDRYYYLMTFDLDGGYGVEPIYARYGMPIEVATPIRAGYAFAGWTDTNGNIISIPETMPVNGGTFRATWKAVNTTYKVSYWYINDDGTRSLIGSRVELGTSGDTVSGKDDLKGSVICGNEADHRHTDECYSCGNAHTTACFDVDDNDPQDDGRAVIEAIEGSNDPEAGYVYVIRASNGTLWPKIYLNGNYYTINGIGAGNTPATEAEIDQIIEGDVLGTGAAGDLTVEKYKLNIGKTHKDVNRTCREHTHDDTCYEDTTYLEYIGPTDDASYTTDQNVVIAGNGTSVVNVYYRYKEYTLRFYYAATTGGTENDADKNPDTYDTIKIVGGTSYYFGSWGPDTSDDETLLENEYWNYANQWGQISSLPTLNENGQKKNYTHGTEVFTHNGTAVTYHYISFNARYGDDISGMWPCAVFNSATRTDKNNANGWSGTEAFVSAWNGEHHVKYSQDNSNETIKGIYERLDENLLFHSKYTDEDTVSYLCFWENGANIGWSVPELYRYNIYLEAYGGQDLTGKTTISRNGKTYYLSDSYDTCDNSTVAEQTQVSLMGYEKAGYTYEELTDFDETLYKEAYEINFFYNAKKYRLSFWNWNDHLTDGTGSMVAYNEPLKKYFEGTTVNGTTYEGANDLIAKPEYYPDTLEPGAYEFEGWYTSAQFEPETRVDQDNITMPGEALTVYANWTPVVHHVRVFLTEDRADEGSEYEVEFWIPHGELVPEAQRPADPTNGDYQFIGWFYRDSEGKEQAFDFANMPVKDGMHLYAKWSSNVLKNYTIRYVTKDAEGNEIEIASPTVGSALAGSTKTFNAKGGSELYLGYREGYFPLTKSHSITLNIEQDGAAVYTFEYVQKEAVPYTVHYYQLDLDGNPVYKTDGNGNQVNVSVRPSKTVSTKQSEVVENYVMVPGYRPDDFQKALIISVETGADNTIIFWYRPNTTHAFLRVNHYLEDIPASEGAAPTWTPSRDYSYANEVLIEGNKVLSYSESPVTIEGFTYDATVPGTKLEGTLSSVGQELELKLYYRRNLYPYEIRYLELGTNKVLADPVSGPDYMDYYGNAITASEADRKTIDGYAYHAATGCTIAVENNPDRISKNIITVYYVPVTGNLRVTKDIEIINSNAPVPSDQVFEFTLHLPDGIAESYSVTIGGNKQVIPATEGKLKFYLKDGESALIEGLPQGPSTNKYQYTVTETPVPGFESSFSPSGAVEVTQGETTEVICTNQYPVGNLKIVKKVEKEFSGDTWTGDRFSFTITSDALNRDGKEYMVSINGGNEVAYPANDHSIVIKDVEVSSANPEVTIEIANVPAGSYTVTENDGSALGGTYTTTANGKTGYSATVTVAPVEGPALVTFVNTVKRTTGNLYVSKMIQIVPDSGAEIDEAAEFTFTVQMPTDKPENFFAGKTYAVKEHATLASVTVDENGRFTFQLKHNEHVIVEDLPVGSYVVAESFSEGYASSFPVANPDDGSVSAEVVITTDAEPRLECVNTYPVHRGKLKITKTVQAASGIQKNPADTFQFQIAFTPKGSSRDFPATHYDKNGEQTPVELAVTETSSGKVQLTAWLKDGESILIENLPAGECTVTEVDIPAIYTAVGNNRKVTIAADQTTGITMTNQYKLFDLTIEKTNAEEDQVFVYEVKDSEGKIITVTVVGNSSTTIHNLLPGNYTVTQKNLWSWRYDEQDESKTVEVDEVGEKVIFSDKVSDDHWLDGNSQLVVNRKGA